MGYVFLCALILMYFLQEEAWKRKLAEEEKLRLEREKKKEEMKKKIAEELEKLKKLEEEQAAKQKKLDEEQAAKEKLQETEKTSQPVVLPIKQEESQLSIKGKCLIEQLRLEKEKEEMRIKSEEARKARERREFAKKEAERLKKEAEIGIYDQNFCKISQFDVLFRFC